MASVRWEVWIPLVFLMVLVLQDPIENYAHHVSCWIIARHEARICIEKARKSSKYVTRHRNIKLLK